MVCSDNPKNDASSADDKNLPCVFILLSKSHSAETFCDIPDDSSLLAELSGLSLEKIGSMRSKLIKEYPLNDVSFAFLQKKETFDCFVKPRFYRKL